MPRSLKRALFIGGAVQRENAPTLCALTLLCPTTAPGPAVGTGAAAAWQAHTIKKATPFL